ncbi:MAG: hypothetical protein R3C18_12700 [Planctomycetaceae bacterium]
MRFDARIPDDERRQLASLIGRELFTVSADGWAVQFDMEALSIQVIPEEIATPDDDHKCADVTRPSLTETTDATTGIVASNLGVITAVSVLSTVVVFSPPELGEPIEINGVTIPEGISYGPEFFHPSRPPSVSSGQAIVDLDIAFELRTDSNNRITVFTDGCGYFVYVTVNEYPISTDIYLECQIPAADIGD